MSVDFFKIYHDLYIPVCHDMESTFVSRVLWRYNCKYTKSVFGQDTVIGFIFVDYGFSKTVEFVSKQTDNRTIFCILCNYAVRYSSVYCGVTTKWDN